MGISLERMDASVSPLLYLAILLANPLAALSSPRWADRESATMLIEAGALPIDRLGEAILDTADPEVWRRLVRAIRRLKPCPSCQGDPTRYNEYAERVSYHCKTCEGCGSDWLKAHLAKKRR